MPIETHKYIIERISGCNHAKHKLFSRYIKFTYSLGKSNKVVLRHLFGLIHRDVRSVTGANLRYISGETNRAIIEGNTKRVDLSDYKVYKMPAGEEWRIPLLLSLMQLRDENWIVTFDEEDTESNLETDAITTMINNVCTL